MKTRVLLTEYSRGAGSRRLEYQRACGFTVEGVSIDEIHRAIHEQYKHRIEVRKRAPDTTLGNPSTTPCVICGQPSPERKTRGPIPKYCSHSCRQTAYLKRNFLKRQGKNEPGDVKPDAGSTTIDVL